SDRSKVYGQSDPAAGWSYGGFVGGDSAGTVSITGGAACSYASHSANVGTYAGVISCEAGNLATGNYSFQQGRSGMLTVTKAVLSVNASDRSKVYGQSDPTPGWSYSGFVAGDNAGNVTIAGSPVCSYASHSENVGTYTNA